MRVIRCRDGLELYGINTGSTVTVNDMPAGETAPGTFHIEGDFTAEHAVLVAVNGTLHPLHINNEEPKKGLTVATYAVYDADIREFVEYYRSQGARHIWVYVGRSYVPKEAPRGSDIEYIAWPGGAGAAEEDAKEKRCNTEWFAWIPMEERYYVARSIQLAEYLETVTSSFDVLRVQAHLARRTESGELEYCKDPLPWGTKCGFVRRCTFGAGGAVLDSGVAKKLHLVTDPLPGTVYTVPCKS